jgi:multicomponent Na+:H+ antiporter subunit D
MIETTMFSAIPAVLLFGGGILLPLMPRRIRSALFVFLTITAFFLLSRLEPGATFILPFLDYQLVITRVDRLSLAFGYVFMLVAFLGAVYSFHLKDTSQAVAALFYAGSALGVVFAGDWLTLYVFWEIMAISSVWLIWSARNARSARAGMRYLLMHLFGGLVLLAGILWHVSETGSLLFNRLEVTGPAALILIGFGVNAAIPPLHAWLVDAYPEATITGSVFLSAFTTKAAVYVLARGFPGWELLVAAGTIMALYGVVFALVENDIRRILAYHIVSQVGYMVAGVGLGTETAINGSTAHAFAHILYKGQLFMATGAVLFATGRRKLTDLGGLAAELQWVLTLYMIAALSISSFPLLSGFVSKALVIHAAELEHRDWTVLFLHAASVGTFLSVGLKLPYFTWFGGSRALRPAGLPAGMYVAMIIAAAANIVIGLRPQLFYRLLPFPVEYRPYTAAHLLETLELLGFTGLVFWFLRRQIAPRAALTLDFDWFYRKPAPWLWRHVVVGVDQLFAAAESAMLALTRWLIRLARDPFALAREPAHRDKGHGTARADRHTYDPDVYRPPVGTLVLVVILCFVLLFGWSLVRTVFGA